MIIEFDLERQGRPDLVSGGQERTMVTKDTPTTSSYTPKPNVLKVTRHKSGSGEGKSA